MEFLSPDCIIIRYNHNHIIKIVKFSRGGGGGIGAVAPDALRAIHVQPCQMCIMFDFKILFAIIFIINHEIFQLSHVIFIIQFLYVNQVFSQIHVRVAHLFLCILLCRKEWIDKDVTT